MKALPPKWAERFINWLTDSGTFEDIPGDLREDFEANKERRGVKYAKIKYVFTVICFIRSFIIRDKFNLVQNTSNFGMLPNYWIVACRSHHCADY